MLRSPLTLFPSPLSKEASQIGLSHWSAGVDSFTTHSPGHKQYLGLRGVSDLNVIWCVLKAAPHLCQNSPGTGLTGSALHPLLSVLPAANTVSLRTHPEVLTATWSCLHWQWQQKPVA